MALGVLLPASAWLPPATPGATAAPTAFANPQFERLWSLTDGPVASGAVSRSWLWGPGPGEARSEPFDGAPGGTRSVQYFDKARMEVNSAVTGPSNPWAVTTGLLVVEMVSGRVQTGPNRYEKRSPAAIPVAGDGTGGQAASSAPLYSSFAAVASLPGGPSGKAQQATGSVVMTTIDRSGTVGTLPANESSQVRYSAYSAETGHNIPDVFARYMQEQIAPQIDPVYLLGYPITEAYWTTVPVSGKATRVLVQLYQRRVLTYIPGFDPAWQVQMGNVGQHYYSWRYALTPAPAPAPAATPAPGADDTFVHIVGNQLFYAGKPVLLKGTNYWLHTQPGVGTFGNWDGTMVQAELDKARQLGVNSIRIGISYDQPLGLDAIWGKGCSRPGAQCDQVNGMIVNEMTQALQIAASYNMKVIFTLFEWSNKFPAPGTPEYTKQMTYLHALVQPFVNDDRLLGWDLHNEPENYDTWKLDNNQAAVLAWVANIAGEVHNMDHHHPVTVGVGNYQNLWLEAGGRKLLDLVDFVSFHCYDAGGLRTQIDAVQAHTNKPILLEEMGWPTGPAKLSTPQAAYDEPTQQFLYRTMLGDAKASQLVGVMQWALMDNPVGTPDHYIKPTVDSWFGLVRENGSFKPAAADFRDSYPSQPLPSTTKSDVPLTLPDGTPAK